MRSDDKRVSVTLYITEGEWRQLQEIAYDLTFRQERGWGAGVAPNVSAMVRAIAHGDIRLIGPAAPRPEECVEALDLALKLVKGPLRDVLLLMRHKLHDALPVSRHFPPEGGNG